MRGRGLGTCLLVGLALITNGCGSPGGGDATHLELTVGAESFRTDRVELTVSELEDGRHLFLLGGGSGDGPGIDAVWRMTMSGTGLDGLVATRRDFDAESASGIVLNVDETRSATLGPRGTVRIEFSLSPEGDFVEGSLSGSGWEIPVSENDADGLRTVEVSASFRARVRR